MLTAHKEDQPFDVARASQGTPQPHPLSGILDSIQGLRILLDDLSLEDIIEADEKAQKLIQRLCDFHSDLTNLSHIQKLVSKAKELTKRIEAPFDLGEFTDANENTKKLVERLSAFYNDLTNLSHIQNLLVRAKDITLPTEALPRVPKQESPKRVLQNQGGTLPNNLILFPTPVRHAREMTRAPAPTHSLRPFLPKEQEQLRGEDDLHLLALLQNTASLPAVTDHVPLEGPQSSDPLISTGREKHLQPPDQPEELSLEKAEPASKVLSPNEDSSIPQPVTLEHNQSTSPSEETERDQKRDTPVNDETSAAIGIPPSRDSERASNQDYRSASERITVEFDQKLLTDLIKDYGEFVTYSNLNSPKIQEKVIAPDPEFMRQPANDYSDDREPKPLPKPVPYRNEGDLDRTLKKLIKDYGEYDIYSHRNPNNVKKVVIATSTVLVLLLSLSFFYFRYTTDSPSKLSPTRAEAFSANTDSDASTRTPPRLTKKDHLSDAGPSRLQGGSDGVTSVFSATETNLLNNKKE